MCIEKNINILVCASREKDLNVFDRTRHTKWAAYKLSDGDVADLRCRETDERDIGAAPWRGP